MKKLSVVLTAMLITFALGVATAAAKGYVSVNAGAVFVEDADFTDIEGDSGEITTDTGFGLTVAVGGTFAGDRARAELELGYRANDLDEVKYDDPIFGSFDIGGDVTTFSGMANVYFHLLPTTAAISPFIGAGVGLANVEGDIDGLESDDDTVFAYQLAAGTSFAATERLSIDLQYRYFATEDPEFDILESEYTTHNVMAGLRYSF